MIGTRRGIASGIRTGIAVGVAADAIVGGDPASSVPKDIILLAGQSNMGGRALASSITIDSLRQLSGTLSSLSLYQTEMSVDATPVVFYEDLNVLRPRSVGALSQSSTQDFGPEAGFGRLLDSIAPGRFAIAKFSVPGTDIQTNWNVSGSSPSTPPNYFNRLLNFATASEAQLGGRIVGFVWTQGETDAVTTSASTNYKANLGAVFAGIRGRWPGIPIVFNQLSSQYAAVSASLVRYAQSQHYLSSSNTTMVTCDEYTLGDGTHFNADGLADLGVKMARPMLNMLGLHIPLTSSFSAVSVGLTGTFTYVPVTANHTASIALPSVGGVTSWSWTFGDGEVTGGIGPHVHRYASAGSYTASLGIVDYFGASVTSSQVVTVAPPTWAVDATSNKGVPATGSEWQNIIVSQSLTNWSQPAYLWNCQESTGALADSYNKRILVASNSPQYQLVEGGWTRKFVGPNFGSAVSTQFANTGFPDLTGSSSLILGYATFVSQSAGTRSTMFYGSAGVNSFDVVAGLGGATRLKNGTATTNGTLSQTGSVHPFVIRFDRTNGVNAMYTDLEKVAVTYNSITTGSTVTLNCNSTASPFGSTRFGYAAVWTGSYAERSDAEIKALLTALGWTVTGY